MNFQGESTITFLMNALQRWCFFHFKSPSFLMRTKGTYCSQKPLIYARLNPSVTLQSTKAFSWTAVIIQSRCLKTRLILMENSLQEGARCTHTPPDRSCCSTQTPTADPPLPRHAEAETTLPLCFSNDQNGRLWQGRPFSAVNGFHTASSPRASVKSSANTPLQVVDASACFCSPTSRQPVLALRELKQRRFPWRGRLGSQASSSGQTSFSVKNHVFEQRLWESPNVMGKAICIHVL